ncbi:MAG: hypothetical protein CSA29_04155 [Desulfobacterales bacterium]|nr:MAG: hypothetical protein CSA29_04155 [Desulfobacterales bacterium]
MSILEQIISGGQTGADQAALDTAIKFSIPHGGWITWGRRTEDGPLPEKYQLQEMSTTDYPSRTRQNIMNSGGTVILSHGLLTGGSKLTYSFASAAGKPVCHIDLLNNDIFEAALILNSFLLENQIGVLNVAGPRASQDPAIYFDVKSVIESTLYLMFLDKEATMGIAIEVPVMDEQGQAHSLDQAVAWIDQDLSLKTKMAMGRMDERGVIDIYFGLMDYIKYRTGLDNVESPLLERLRRDTKSTVDPVGYRYTPEDGVMVVVKTLKAYMSKHYTLRILP